MMRLETFPAIKEILRIYGHLKSIIHRIDQDNKKVRKLRRDFDWSEVGFSAHPFQRGHNVKKDQER